MDNVIRNRYGEELERIGDIVLNCHYWDCECLDNYIHPVAETRCAVCGYEREEMIFSRENEVEEWRK